MPVERPTFSESWYRVVDLRPRLRGAVQVHRQHYRGENWHVVQDPANNQFYRLNEAGYHFVGLLDGRRTVGEAWRGCNEVLGDAAPTQGEVIQLLGQLYVSNLLRADLPPDTESMFNRFRQRRSREVRGYLSNLLFVRIPLLDPDRFLDRWVGAVGWLFSPAGAVLWVGVIAFGLYSLAGRFGALLDEGQAVRILSLPNLPWLYLSMAIIKTFHEFGHAFACKRFGRTSGSGGEVHVMGIMMLVFTPMPYVDASSAWALPSKWHRAVVGSAGMLVEFFIAAIAAAVWAGTAQTHVLHVLAYNMMFIAGVSSLLFNGNPLLRYDGYYILSDVLEIPNLWQRSREYVYYLVKRYVWGVRRPRCPSQAAGEKAWLTFYALASTVYRVFICVRILLFVSSALPVLGAVLAAGAAVAWLLVPAGKFLHYLLAGQELSRVRPRAVGTTALTLAAVAAAVGVIAVADHVRADSFVRPRAQSVIYARADGLLAEHLPSNTDVHPGGSGGDGPVLFRCTNRLLELQRDAAALETRRLEARRRLEAPRDLAAAQALAEAVQAARKKELRLEEEQARLTVRADVPGRWNAPQLYRQGGAYLKRGTPVGAVVDLRDPHVDAVIEQDAAARVYDQVRIGDRVEMRLPGDPARAFAGRVIEKFPAGRKDIPPALAVTGGGRIAVDPAHQREALEEFFIVRIHPEAGSPVLRPLQLVAVRFELPDKPLAVQWYRSLRQVIQSRFGI